MEGTAGSHLVSVIIPTMRRATLQRAVQSVRAQNVPHELLIRYDPDVNEYVSRERAIADAKGDIIAFLDDDALYRPNALKYVLKYFDLDYGYVQGTCFVQGHPFAYYGTGVGTATFISRSAFDKIGFNYDIAGREARGTAGFGWRMDTCLLYDFMENFGESRYTLADDVEVDHPEMMKGFFNPDAEERFYRRYKPLVDKYILPIDPRLQQFIKERGL